MPKISYKYNVQMNPKLTRDGANAFTHKTSNLICFPRCSLSMQIYGCIAGSRLLLAAPRMTVRRRQCPPVVIIVIIAPVVMSRLVVATLDLSSLI